MITKTFKIEATGYSYAFRAANMADKLGFPYRIDKTATDVSLSMAVQFWNTVQKLLENY